MYKKLILGVAIAAILGCTAAMAEETATKALMEAAKAATDTAVPADLADKIKTLVGAAADSVKATPVNGVFEVKFGGDIFYISGDGRYIFAGDLIDAQTKTSLTE